MNPFKKTGPVVSRYLARRPTPQWVAEMPNKVFPSMLFAGMVMGSVVIAGSAPTVNTFDLDQSNGPRILLGFNPIPTIPTSLAANRTTLSPLQPIQSFTLDSGGSQKAIFIGRTDNKPIIPISSADVGHDSLEPYIAHDPDRPITKPRVFVAIIDAKPVIPISSADIGHDSLEAYQAHDPDRPVTKPQVFVGKVDAAGPAPIPIFTLLQGRITTTVLAPTVASETPVAISPQLVKPSTVDAPPIIPTIANETGNETLEAYIAHDPVRPVTTPRVTLATVDAPPLLNLIPGRIGTLAAYEPFTNRDSYPTNQPVVARVDSVFTPPPTLTLLIQGQINTDHITAPIQPNLEWLYPNTHVLQGFTPTVAASGPPVYGLLQGHSNQEGLSGAKAFNTEQLDKSPRIQIGAGSPTPPPVPNYLLVANRTNLDGGLIPAVSAHQTPYQGIVAAIFWYVENPLPNHPLLQGSIDSAALSAPIQPDGFPTSTGKIQIGAGSPPPPAPPVYLLLGSQLLQQQAYATPQIDRGTRFQVGSSDPPILELGQQILHGYTAYETVQLDRGVRIQIGAGEPVLPPSRLFIDVDTGEVWMRITTNGPYIVKVT